MLEKANDSFYKAYGKINISLAILGKKQGYHILDSIFVKINLYDKMIFKPSKNFNIKNYGPVKMDLGKNNILYKVHKKICGIKKIPNYNIIMEKNIPLRSGIGGASSNAAIYIAYLQKKHRIFSDYKLMLSFDHEMGKDIPFFLFNTNAARVMGIQNIIEPFFIKCKKSFYIFFKDVKKSTKEIYKKYDEKHKNMEKNLTKNEKISKIKQLLINCSFTELKNMVFNDLEEPFFIICPGMLNIYEEIKSKSQLSFLTGAGSSIVFSPKINIAAKNIKKIFLLGCRQAERQRPLEPLFGGSNPSTPAIFYI